MQSIFKTKINVKLINILLIKKKSLFLGLKYKIFVNKNFIFYILSSIFIFLFTFNAVINSSILVNFYFNYNFLYFF